jgi:hypothetical protein
MEGEPGRAPKRKGRLPSDVVRVDREVTESLDDRRQRDPQLETGESSADAVMDAEPE